MLGVERLSVERLEEREFFIESLPVVSLEIGIEDKTSFFDEKTSFFSIDKLSDMLTRFRCFYE